MQLVAVNSKKTAKEFLLAAIIINKNDPNWIRPLDKDIDAVFDPKKNKTFRNGICERWILKDDNSRIIGRIAAFINKKYKTKGDNMPVGGIGFFECINDQNAANFLFDHAKNWLQEKGMEAMDGPINFGERDRWWGLLAEGFYEPLYCMNYNPPYYQQLFENYGFKVFFNQECFAMKVNLDLQQKFFDRHKNFSQQRGISAQHARKKELEKYATDFAKVYNAAWAAHEGGKTLEKKQALALFQQMKPVLDERLLWFVYRDEEPIACWINLPDLNQLFKYMNGKFGWYQNIKFLWLKYRGKCRRFVGIVFGVVPEYQGKGADAYMIVEGARRIQREAKYDDFEMQWIGDFNPKMISIAENLTKQRSRRLITYRYLFDRNKEFKRHPIF